MTSYTNLKSRLQKDIAMFGQHTLAGQALAAIEELEQRVAAQSMGNPAGQLLAEAPASQAVGASGPVGLPARYVSIPSGEPPAQSAPAPAAEPVAWRYLYHDAYGRDLKVWRYKPRWHGMEPIETQPLYAAPQPAQALEQIGWAVVNRRVSDRWDGGQRPILFQNKLTAEYEATWEGDEVVPVYIVSGAPQPAQADEARELLRRIKDDLSMRAERAPDGDSVVAVGNSIWRDLCAYLARTGGSLTLGRGLR